MSRRIGYSPEDLVMEGPPTPPAEIAQPTTFPA